MSLLRIFINGNYFKVIINDDVIEALDNILSATNMCDLIKAQDASPWSILKQDCAVSVVIATKIDSLRAATMINYQADGNGS